MTAMIKGPQGRVGIRICELSYHLNHKGNLYCFGEHHWSVKLDQEMKAGESCFGDTRYESSTYIHGDLFDGKRRVGFILSCDKLNGRTRYSVNWIDDPPVGKWIKVKE